jgi:HlyD family secretion protein
MSVRRIRPIHVGLAFGALTLFGVILRGVADGPPNIARAADVEKAKRDAQPMSGGKDERGPLAPEGNYVAGNGVVEPNGREIRVAAAVPGRIARILVKEGDFVETGALLVELESSVERAALRATEAEVQGAQADYDRVSHGLRREDVDAAIDEANSSRARADLSKTSLQRLEALSKSGGVTADELDRARQTAASDEALARASDARRRAALAGSRAEDVLAAKAKLELARAHREQAQAQLDRMNVQAPQAGEILQVKARSGEYSNVLGDPLLVLGDTRSLRVRVDVDERDIGRVAAGAEAVVTTEAFRDRKFKAKVIDIGRRMGRKNIRTDDPNERIDTKILEVVLQLDDTKPLVPGERVTGFIAASP